ncbi:hypothetical protein F2Q70_00013824 [Brassica cretica]|uniref:Uncharacterized protein n=1 Tax=Brassica cretica TaxID=69181 RepID=A0A8S9M567_BRACR|nr:hypothetical protein F2Q70_00013824 [Brassica cretica]
MDNGCIDNSTIQRGGHEDALSSGDASLQHGSSRRPKALSIYDGFTRRNTLTPTSSNRAKGSSLAAMVNSHENDGVSREVLFEKVATPSDVGKLNRLVVPKHHAENHFPLPAMTTMLVVVDWNSCPSYVLTKLVGAAGSLNRKFSEPSIWFDRNCILIGKFLWYGAGNFPGSYCGWTFRSHYFQLRLKQTTSLRSAVTRRNLGKSNVPS